MALQVVSAVPLDERQQARIRAAGAVELRVADRNDAAALAAALRDAEVLLTGTRLPAGILAHASRLRWIQAITAGVDRLLTPELRARDDVILTCSRGIHAATMAEHALALILAFARNLPAFFRQQAERRWQAHTPRPLAGTTLLVVGLGAIGQEVARRGREAGMRVLGVRRSAASVDGVDRVVSPALLREVLPEAHWVVLVCPLTEETRGLIGEAELRAMRPDAVLINLARGEVVDERALVEALRAGRIAGAGLDVFAEEPLPPENALWSLPNVIITPHVAGALPDYVDAALEVFERNLRRYLAGEPLCNVVDKARGY